MKTQPLNYEVKIFNKDGRVIDDFNFHGETASLARDHAQHLISSWNEDAAYLYYRRLGNVKWIVITKQWPEGDWVLRSDGMWTNRSDVIKDGERLFVIEHYTKDPKERKELDSLISQAKNMYNALKDLIETLPNTWQDHKDIVAAKEILRKANPKQ